MQTIREDKAFAECGLRIRQHRIQGFALPPGPGGQTLHTAD